MKNSKSEPAATPDPAAAAAPSPDPVDAKIEAWHAKHFHGLGSMLDERLYNHIRAAVEDLKAELRQL